MVSIAKTAFLWHKIFICPIKTGMTGFFQSKDHFKNLTPVVKKILEEFNAIICMSFFLLLKLCINQRNELLLNSCLLLS